MYTRNPYFAEKCEYKGYISSRLHKNTKTSRNSIKKENGKYLVRRWRNIDSRLQLVERTETPKNYRVIERQHEEISLLTRTFTRYKTSTKTQSSHKQSSPLHNLVVGARRKSKLNKEKANKVISVLLLDLIHRYSLQHRKFLTLRTQLLKR